MLPLIVIRIANALGKPIGVNPFPRAFLYESVNGDRKSVFNEIYKANGWNSQESHSGPGSELIRTKSYRRKLSKCLDSLNCGIFFDAPCGDLNWILSDIGHRVYIGGDIASELIESLRLKHPDIDLRVFDICEDEFPEADVWHCRDCLFHLSFNDIWKSLHNYVESGIPYAFLTTHRSRLYHRNLDVPAGGWRYLDLELEPFLLPAPKYYLRDFRIGIDFPRYIGVWSRKQIQCCLSKHSAIH